MKTLCSHDEEDSDTTTSLAPVIAKVMKRLHYLLEVMLLCVR